MWYQVALTGMVAICLRAKVNTPESLRRSGPAYVWAGPPKATSARPPPVFARPSAPDRLLGGLRRQRLDYFAAFTNRDHSSIWIGDERVRPVLRMEDGGFALEPHHGAP